MPRKPYITAIRQNILAYLQEKQDVVFSAADVYNTLLQRGIHVDRATVYRNLDHLKKKGLLSCSQAPGENRSLYQLEQPENSHHSHLHLLCRRCGRVIHLSASLMDELAVRFEQQYAFRLESEGSVLMGLCEDCRKSSDEAVSTSSEAS